MTKKNGTAEIIKLADLTPDAQNANRGTERGRYLLEQSLRKNGAGRSILLDKHGRIIAGNKTYETAGEIGLEDAVIVRTNGRQLVAVLREDLDLDTPEGKAMAISDNRAGEVGLEWDTDTLADFAAGGLDLGEWWQDFELAEMGVTAVSGTEEADAEPQINRAEELREQWQTESGQLWRLPSRTAGQEHRLVCGDCTDAAVVERVMGGERAALVVTDPPYGVEYADKNKFLNAISRGNHIQTPIDGDHGDKGDIQDTWKRAFAEMNNVMRPGAVVYCFMPQGGDQMMMMMMMMMMGAGIEPRHELIWLKNNHVLGRVDYAYKHEPILYAWKAGGHKFYGDFQTSVIECAKPQKSELHPTTKPAELVERLIANSSQGRDIIYDPFVGSGTTIIAAENLSRQCRAVEISPAYVAVCLERYRQAFGIEPEPVK